MTWFRVDDSFSDHPKVVALRGSRSWKGALALWTLAGSWASKQESDGVIPLRVVRHLGGSEAEAEALVGVSLWERVDGGYRFHDWSDSNPTSDELQAKRSKTKERVSKWREQKSTSKTGNDVTNALPEDPVTLLVTPPPSRPVPSRPVPSQESERARATGAERQAAGEALVRREFGRRFEAAEGSLWPRHGDPAVVLLAAWLGSLSSEPEAALARLLDAFFADPWCRSQHFPIQHLAKYPQKYFEPREAPSVAKSMPHGQLAALRAEHKALVDRGEFGDELTRVTTQIRQLEKELDASRGGEPRRAFGR